MRTHNLELVADALKGKALTRDQLAQRTGLSYHTVKRALIDLEAKSSDSYPVTYRVNATVIAKALVTANSRQQVRSRRVRVPEGAPTLAVAHRVEDDWVLRWNDNYPDIAKSLAVIRPDNDPDKLAQVFVDLASSFASIAYVLDSNSTNPTWFSDLGGKREA